MSIRWLLLALLIQAGMVAFVFQEKPALSSTASKTVFIDAPLQAVDRLEIGTMDGKRVVVEKQQGQWLLPDYSKLPVQKGMVTRLLDDLARARVSLPAGITESAARRFQVDKAGYQRRLTLYRQGKKLAEIYFGKSAGYQIQHARLQGDPRIYTIKLGLNRLPPEPQEWFDHQILQPVLPLSRVEGKDFVLIRQNGQWKLENSEDRKRLKSDELTRQLNYLKFLQVTEVAPSVNAEEKPAFSFRLKDRKGDLQLDFFRRDKHVIVKSSRFPLYFKVAEYLGRNLAGFDRKSIQE